MRFMLDFDGIENIGDMDIDEIVSVRSYEMFNPRHKNDTPSNIFIELYRPNDTQEMAIMGEYKLDGTKDTYNKAIANYKKVVNQLFTKGYARASDFENVEWV